MNSIEQLKKRDTNTFKTAIKQEEICQTCLKLLDDLSRIGIKYTLLQEAYYFQQNELNNLKMLIGNDEDYNLTKKLQIRIKDLLQEINTQTEELNQIKKQLQDQTSNQAKIKLQKAGFKQKKSQTSHSFTIPQLKKSPKISRIQSQVVILPLDFNQRLNSQYFHRIDQIRKLHNGEINDLQLSPCTLYLATCAHDQDAVKITDLYSLQTETIYQKFDASEEVLCLNFSNNCLIGGTNKGSIKIWDTNLIIHNFGMISNIDPNHTFNTSTCKPINAISKINQTIYTISDDMVLRFWNTDKGCSQTHILPEVPYYLNNFDQESLLVGSENGSVYLYKYKIDNKMALKYQSDWLYNTKIKYIDVKDDRELIISTCRGFEQVDIRNMQSLGIYEQSQGNLTNAVYINEGRQMIQGLGDYQIKIFKNKNIDQQQYCQEYFNSGIKSMRKLLYDASRYYLYVVGKNGEFSYTSQKMI